MLPIRSWISPLSKSHNTTLHFLHPMLLTLPSSLWEVFLSMISPLEGPRQCFSLSHQTTTFPQGREGRILHKLIPSVELSQSQIWKFYRPWLWGLLLHSLLWAYPRSCIDSLLRVYIETIRPEGAPWWGFMLALQQLFLFPSLLIHIPFLNFHKKFFLQMQLKPLMMTLLVQSILLSILLLPKDLAILRWDSGVPSPKRWISI